MICHCHPLPLIISYYIPFISLYGHVLMISPSYSPQKREQYFQVSNCYLYFILFGGFNISLLLLYITIINDSYKCYCITISFLSPWELLFWTHLYSNSRRVVTLATARQISTKALASQPMSRACQGWWRRSTVGVTQGRETVLGGAGW